jgi:hypothetical protein
MLNLIPPPSGFIPKVNTLNNGHWKFPEQMGASDYSGFIYIIRDNYMGRFYLGKKSYRSTKGAVRGQEMNWRYYTSSSNLMKEMFAERPRSEFDFFCVEQYKTRGTLSYAETWSLCHVEAPTTPTWYNHLIEKVSWNVKEPISSRHKERMSAIIRGETP